MVSNLSSSENDLPTLAHILLHRAQTQPDKIGFHFLNDAGTDETTLTYYELHVQAQAIASQLQQDGILPGDRVMLLYPPGLEFISALLGCFYAGIIAVPASAPRPDQPLSRLFDILSDAQSVVVLSTKAVVTQCLRNDAIGSYREYAAFYRYGCDKSGHCRCMEPTLRSKTTCWRFFNTRRDRPGIPKGSSCNPLGT